MQIVLDQAGVDVADEFGDLWGEEGGRLLGVFLHVSEYCLNVLSAELYGQEGAYRC